MKLNNINKTKNPYLEALMTKFVFFLLSTYLYFIDFGILIDQQNPPYNHSKKKAVLNFDKKTNTFYGCLHTKNKQNTNQVEE